MKLRNTCLGSLNQYTYLGPHSIHFSFYLQLDVVSGEYFYGRGNLISNEVFSSQFIHHFDVDYF